MDGWSVSKWADGVRIHKRLRENSDRFRKIKVVRSNMLDVLGSRISDVERNEALFNMEKVHHVMQSTVLESNKMQCAICLLIINCEAIVMECGHMFHYVCAREWGWRSLKCAVCRQNIHINGKKIGVTGLWLKFMTRLTIKERMEVTEPLRIIRESKWLVCFWFLLYKLLLKYQKFTNKI